MTSNAQLLNRMGRMRMRRTRTATEGLCLHDVVGVKAAGIELAGSAGFVASAVDSYANGLTLPVGWSLAAAAGCAALAAVSLVAGLFF